MLFEKFLPKICLRVPIFVAIFALVCWCYFNTKILPCFAAEMLCFSLVFGSFSVVVLNHK
ncbi:hypothetical protein SLEP1_g24617 [Rubroshorea leprosula]|uniref:ATP synthase F0 subunit 8 n=1 Tax=Rubroshorea leprosula TaxID=152421 RepID=A0AAV5JLJ3_9ROSI|nr:hypothetical protein SLEP1_g24617 [Rubroshorea leprosula]